MLKAAENMRGKSALLYRVTGHPGHRLHIFLNSAYEQKTGIASATNHPARTGRGAEAVALAPRPLRGPPSTALEDGYGYAPSARPARPLPYPPPCPRLAI